MMHSTTRMIRRCAAGSRAPTYPTAIFHCRICPSASSEVPALRSPGAVALRSATRFSICRPCMRQRRVRRGASRRQALAPGPSRAQSAHVARLGRLVGLARWRCRGCCAPTRRAALRRPRGCSRRLQAQFSLPARIGDFTDFYASIHHATAVGRLLRPNQPLMPNYKWMPIAYHGRASSVRVSQQAFPRPCGQSLPAGATAPIFGPSRRLDYELEIGLFVGPGNALGACRATYLGGAAHFRSVPAQ